MNLIGQPVEIYPLPSFEDEEGFIMKYKGIAYRGHIVAYDQINREYCIEYVVDLSVKYFMVIDPTTDKQVKIL